MAVVIDRFEGSPSTVEFEDMDDEHLRHWAALSTEALEIWVRRQYGASTVDKRHGTHNQKDHGRKGKGKAKGFPSLSTSTRMSDLSPKGRAAVEANNTKYGITQAGLEAELESHINPQSTKDGKAWYPQARQFNEELAERAGLSVEQTTAITALVSPRTPWPRNKRLAERVALNYHKYDDIDDPREAGRALGGGLSANLGAGIDVARGGDIDANMTGPKRRSFYNNMLNPGETDDVTVDTWMQRSAMNSATIPMSLDQSLDFMNASKAATNGSGAGYVAIAEAVRAVGDRHGMTGDEVQSAYWIAASGGSEGAHAGTRSEERPRMTHSQRDARSIEAWFEADPGTEIPESSESASVLAHENQSAWAHVDPLKLRGLSTMEAQAHMVTMARLATRHGTHNQKSHGNKKGGGAPRTKLKCCGSVKQIESDVYAGRPTVARPEQVAALMEDFKDGPSTNLGVLTIAGQECCFQNHHPAEIPRSEMPQLPTTVEGLQHFVDELGKRGIKATIEQVDPSTLTATQNELDAKKVAKLYGFMKPPGGWQEGGALLISNDNFVVDGHHRWAGAAAVAAGGDPIKVTAIRIDMPIDDALALAQEFSGERFGLGQGVQV